MTRDDLKQTAQWQALNTIWKGMTGEQRKQLNDQFKLLTEFIKKNAKPTVNYAAMDAAYQDALSPEARQFAQLREQEDSKNLYADFMKLIGGSTFEEPEKVLFFYTLKYGRTYPWIQDYPDEVEEILNLAWKRHLERGFVPGQGYPRG